MKIKLNRQMTLVPVFQVIATNTGGDKSTEILAAVGAGLVPATMAIIAPMLLGRKRRSANHSTKLE